MRPTRENKPSPDSTSQQTGARVLFEDFRIAEIAAQFPRFGAGHPSAHVYAIDDGITKRPAALDDPPAHGSDIVIYRRSC
jgi:hypothetical protein